MDELERSLRTLLTDERLEVAVPHDTVAQVQLGVRRRRAMHRAVLASAATVAIVLGGTFAATGSSLPDRVRLALGGDDDEPNVSASPVPSTSQTPPAKPEPPQRIAWNPRPYDGVHPVAFPADPPACEAGQLTASLSDFGGATGSAAASVRVRNNGERCLVTGAPTVLGTADDGTARTTEQRDLQGSVAAAAAVVEPDGGAVALVVISGDRSRCLGPVDRLDVSVVPGGPTTSMPTRWGGGGDVTPRCATVPEAQQRDLYDMAVGGWRPDPPNKPSSGGISPTLRRTPASVVAGDVLRYQVSVDAGAAGETPCQPFRERLVGADGAVVASEAYLLPCTDIRAATGSVVFLEMRLAVPATVAAADLRLEWATPAGDLVTAPVHVAAAPPQCEQSQLRLSAGPGGAAAGTYYNAVVFTNVSDDACSLFGYPGVEFVDAGGAHLPTRPHHMTDVPRESVVLAAQGGKAFARLASASANPSGPEPCQEVAGLDVIAPGLTEQVLVPDVATYCLDGFIEVWPVVPGTRRNR
jgi:hypothetical protein